jgi:hypothetical protein
MVDSTLSGYKQAATAFSFTGTRTLVSLASDEYTDESDAVDNSGTKYMAMDLEWVSTAVAYVSPAIIQVYLLPSLDDTNFPDWEGDGVADVEENEQYYVASFTLNPGSNAQRHVIRNVAMPNGLFKVAVRNKTGIALAATGSTLKYRPHQYASA